MKPAFVVAFVATASADEGSPVGKVIEKESATIQTSTVRIEEKNCRNRLR